MAFERLVEQAGVVEESQTLKPEDDSARHRFREMFRAFARFDLVNEAGWGIYFSEVRARRAPRA